MLNEIIKAEIADILSKSGGQVLFDEPLYEHSTISIGSSADVWCIPHEDASVKELISYLKNKKIKTFILGNGSNVLMPDVPFEGAIINLSSNHFTRVEFEKDEVICGAGARLPEVIALSTTKGLSGMEGLVGIPATIGGAIFLNAGHLQAISDHLTRVKVLSEGEIKWLKKDKIDFSYHSSSLNKEDIILEAVFKLNKTSSDEVQKKVKENLDDKISKQPLAEKSLGCVFKNPESGKYKSAELIDKAGLKGRRKGDAQVSEKHANFIINTGEATQSDFICLMKEVQSEVRERFGVDLEPEIEIL